MRSLFDEKNIHKEIDSTEQKIKNGKKKEYQLMHPFTQQNKKFAVRQSSRCVLSFLSFLILQGKQRYVK